MRPAPTTRKTGARNLGGGRGGAAPDSQLELF
jgi:hypothetical protein